MSTDRPAVQEISSEQRSLIEKHNRLDIELFAYARARFEAAIGAAGDDLKTHLEALRIACATAVEDDAAAFQAACEWLDDELPLGVTAPRQAIDAAAAKAGIRTQHMKRAKQHLGVKKWGGDTVEVQLTRVGDLDSDETVLQEARAWLERALPMGVTKSRASLQLEAHESGIAVPILNRIIAERPGIEKWGGETGEVKFTRIGEPGPQNELLRGAREWLERALPVGEAKSRAALQAEAHEAGIETPVLKHVLSELPGIEKWGGDEGEVRFTRTPVSDEHDAENSGTG